MRWPPKVLRLLAALLLSRKLYATYDGRVTGPRQATVDLAQGSVLSPILYILYTSGISRNLPQAVTSLKFADDETLLARGPDLPTVLRTLQDGLQILADNLREGGAHLSPTKSTLCIFTRRRVPAVRDRIILDGVPLPESTEARCLGLIFDSKLTWKAHIRHVKQRCAGVLSFMRTIAHTSWGAHPALLRTAYLSLLRPIMEYGMGIYDPRTRSGWRPLERLQNHGEIPGDEGWAPSC